MGDDAFLLGNVYDDDYRSLINNSVCRTVCAASILESLPDCCDCVYQQYCGRCPVVNYAICEDVIDKKHKSYRCEIYSGMLDYIFNLLLQGDEKTTSILDDWSN